ncbi:MAG: DNA helicase-2/ATP-dependent DNA helicase PcrA [Flammeovirgaceae bacterium]|jgi:DNA helicase-2/ATP-dependent DNA helicase PcrA
MTEIEQILNHIDNQQNFLLSGGAGSGKTYTLVETIRGVIEKNPSSLVACMTYTNSAVKEIEERVNHKNLNVTTIHDFLWDNIKHFQREIKECLVELANDPANKSVKIDSEKPITLDFFKDAENSENTIQKIQYREHLRLSKGFISHDQVISLSEIMFKKYGRLCDIVKDKYKFIFVDEYQDTQKEVIQIFLDHFNKTAKKNVIGFFGDSMQSIYAGTIGNLDEYVEKEQVKEVQKQQNRRCPNSVINLANKLRLDGLVQHPSEDINAPNMEDGIVKEGEVHFLYSDIEDIELVKKYLGWDFTDTKNTKELNLTHNLIATKGKFRNLMDIYDKDPIISLKNSIVTKHKANKNKGIGILINEEESFNTVVETFNIGSRIHSLKKNEIMSNPKHAVLYEQLKDKPFSEVRKIYATKDQLIDDTKRSPEDIDKKGNKRDPLIRHLHKLQNLIRLYQNGKYNEFLQKTDYNQQFYRNDSKRILKQRIEELINVGNKTIGEVLEEANTYSICCIGDDLISFKEKNSYIYNQVEKVEFTEFQALYDYVEGLTPFSTQHKTKGNEFENVLVVADNGGWNSYNFKHLFENTSGKESIIEKTKKIFYVCCTRAKNNLAVYYNSPSESVIEKAKEWFGEGKVKDLKSPI